MISILFEGRLDSGSFSRAQGIIRSFFEQHGVGSYLNTIVSYATSPIKNAQTKEQTIKGKVSLDKIFMVIDELLKSPNQAIYNLEISFITFDNQFNMAIQIMDANQMDVRVIKVTTKDETPHLELISADNAWGHLHLQEENEKGLTKSPIAFIVISTTLLILISYLVFYR